MNSIEPLGKYEGETITLDLPGEMTVFEIDWISIWDIENDISFGYISMPDGLNIPPSLAVVMKKETRLPNCEQLHRDVQVAWEIFGPQITFEMSVQMGDNEYISFGLSGSDNSSRMIGSDVAISWLDGHLGHTVDYNITDYYPCTNVLGYWRGVCPDVKMGGVDNFQIHTFFREDGITRLTFRRNLQNNDEGDRVFDKDNKNQYIVWAVGSLNDQKEPRYHRLYPRRDAKLHFGRKPEKKCYSFTRNPDSFRTLESTQLKPWGPLRVVNQTLTTFYARLGVPGGQRGFIGSTGKSSPGLVWYMNGLMAAVLYVKRGRSYVFNVEGGNNPYNAYTYHPLYITNDPSGGYVKLTEAERKKHIVYAGVEFDKKGRPSPTAAGRLCLWSYSKENDPRKADKYVSFTQFRSSLNYTCERGSASLLQWTPTASTPDIVYYQSYTQRNMGWKIVVLDDFSATSQVQGSTGSVSVPSSTRSSSSLSIVLLVSSFIYIFVRSSTAVIKQSL